MSSTAEVTEASRRDGVTHAIKAIPTEYAKVTFRSRLEARWAVYFDALGIKWFYEYEGFELPSGRYLPDFFLPDIRKGLWVEVKPSNWHGSDTFLFELVRMTKYDAVLAKGPPCTPILYPNNICPTVFYSKKGIVHGGYAFCDCPDCGRLGFEFDGLGGRIHSCTPESGGWPTGDEPRFKNAVIKAMNYRFWK